MKTLFVSFYSSANLGDLLISSSLEHKLENYAEVYAVDYLGRARNKERQLTPSKSAPYKKESWKTKVKRFNQATGLNHLVMRLRKTQQKFSNPAFEKHLDKVEALVIGGGNMIFDLEGDTLSAQRFDYYVSKAKAKNLPVFAISIGIGPFQNKYQQRYAAEVLAKCDYITFRDHQALALFKEYQPQMENVGLVPDPVFFLENKLTDATKDKIGLNIINPVVYPNHPNPERVKQDYRELISKLLNQTDKEVILYNTTTNDFPFCQEVYEAFESKHRVHLTRVESLSDLYALYSQLDLVIGTRMHSMIIAFSQGIPIIGLSYQQKVQAMFELLNDRESVFSLKNLSKSLDNLVKQVTIELDDKSDYHFETQKMLAKKEEINAVFLNKLFNER